MWELAQEKNAKAERRAKSEIRAAEELPEQEASGAVSDFDDVSEKKRLYFRRREAHELEELLRTIIGNRV